MLANAAPSPKHNSVTAFVFGTHRAPLMRIAYLSGATFMSRQRTAHEPVFEGNEFGWTKFIVGCQTALAFRMVSPTTRVKHMTIKFLHRELAIDVLRPSERFKSLVKEPLTAALADSIKLLGQLHEPLVRRGDTFHVLHGNRKIAAHIRLGRKTVLCKLIYCSDLEAQAMVELENARGDFQSTTTIVNALERVRLEQRANPDKRRGGRPAGLGKAAREAMAAALGLSPKALEVRQEREKRAERAADEPKAPAAEAAAASISVFGMDVDKDFLTAVLAAHEYVSTARQYAVLCQGALARLANSGTPYPQRRTQQMRTAANELSSLIASFLPSSLCPWCKGVPSVMRKCAACSGVGIIVAQQEAQVPSELRDDARPKVSVHGKFVDVEKL